MNPVTLSRREFTALVGASALGHSSQNPAGEPVTAETARVLLDAHGGGGIFADGEWLELLRRALELNAETRARLRRYSPSSDTEPTITFVRY